MLIWPVLVGGGSGGGGPGAIAGSKQRRVAGRKGRLCALRLGNQLALDIGVGQAIRVHGHQVLRLDYVNDERKRALVALDGRNRLARLVSGSLALVGDVCLRNLLFVLQHLHAYPQLETTPSLGVVATAKWRHERPAPLVHVHIAGLTLEPLVDEPVQKGSAMITEGGRAV